MGSIVHENEKEKGSSLSTAFLPLNICLQDRLVIVFGGNLDAFLEIVKVLDAGSRVLCVAKGAESQIQALKVTHGTRLTLLRQNAEDFLDNIGEHLKAESKAPALMLSFIHDGKVSELVADYGRSHKLPVFVQFRPDLTDFSLPTLIKRGHLKVSVSTDGILPCLEKALLSRLEATVHGEFDRMTIFVSQVEERLSLAYPEAPESRARVMGALEEDEDFVQAVKRMSFDEALRLLDHKIANGEAKM